MSSHRSATNRRGGKGRAQPYNVNGTGGSSRCLRLTMGKHTVLMKLPPDFHHQETISINCSCWVKFIYAGHRTRGSCRLYSNPFPTGSAPDTTFVRIENIFLAKNRIQIRVRKKHMVVSLLGAKTNSCSPQQHELSTEALWSPSLA